MPKNTQASILYRESLVEPEELAAMEASFNTSKSMVGLNNQLVIGRYAVLPFYEEVEYGLGLQGSRLVNSLRAHKYIANFEYYHDIEDMTPKTYFSLAEVPKFGGPFVVKGKTNSRKHNWDTQMYAANKEEAVRIALDLGQDSLIGNQEVIVRDFVPLVNLEIGINGLPFANEHRCFFYGEQLLSSGFYWSIAEARGELSVEGLEVAKAAAARVSQTAKFFTIDVAQKATGGWTVIEVNDGQMAGLSLNKAQNLYPALKEAVASQELDRMARKSGRSI